MRLSQLILLSILVASCSKKEATEILEYKGPLREVENVELFFSERNVLKVKMTAPKLFEFATNDREFPEGVYIEFYSLDGTLQSVIKANYAYYSKATEEWKATGNVEVKNLETKQQLNTEELFWKPVTKKIRSDKFVTIRLNETVIYGNGLIANEDLSDYEILDISGDLNFENQ